MFSKLRFLYFCFVIRDSKENYETDWPWELEDIEVQHDYITCLPLGLAV